MLLEALSLMLQAGAPTPPPSDVRLLRDARAAQSRFEGIRRMNLPRDRSGGSGGRCDVRVGRYCYWYDSTETARVPEPPRIASAREALIRSLDAAAAVDPRSEWILGQRTRYLIEAGRESEAFDKLAGCGAASWWCSALAGLALHADRRYGAADSAFGAALLAMPPAQRCEWTDIRQLVNDALAREIGREDCDGRAALANRLWRLAQPLWITTGNDLRTEHFARRTMAVILAGSANAHGMSFGADSRELLLRYGWAEWYTREWPGMYGATPGITGHDREPSYAFFPDVPSVAHAMRLSDDAWALRAPSAESRYSPRHLEYIGGLEHQLARFPRGDSLLIAVGHRVTDTVLARDRLRGAIAFAPGTAAERIAGPPGALRRTIALTEPSLVSIEVLGDSSRRAARARTTVEPLPCGDAARCLSDLLLFEPGASDSRDLDDALRRAYTTRRLAVTRPLGVYWEIQGAAAGSARMTLTVEPVRTNALRRLATRLRLARERTTVRLHWQATLDPGLTRQSVTLRLPERARGAYRLELTVQPPAGTPLRSAREISVEPRD